MNFVKDCTAQELHHSKDAGRKSLPSIAQQEYSVSLEQGFWVRDLQDAWQQQHLPNIIQKTHGGPQESIKGRHL